MYNLGGYTYGENGAHQELSPPLSLGHSTWPQKVHAQWAQLSTIVANSSPCNGSFSFPVLLFSVLNPFLRPFPKLLAWKLLTRLCFMGESGLRNKLQFKKGSWWYQLTTDSILQRRNSSLNFSQKQVLSISAISFSSACYWLLNILAFMGLLGKKAKINQEWKRIR